MQSKARCILKGPGALGLVENEAAFDAGLSTGFPDYDTWQESFPGILPTDAPGTSVHPPRLQKEKIRQGDEQSGALEKHVRVRLGTGVRAATRTQPWAQQQAWNTFRVTRRGVLLRDCLQGMSPAPTQMSQRPSQGPACLLGCLPQPERVPLRSFVSFFQTVVLDEKFGKPWACEWPSGFEPRLLRQAVLVQFSHPHLFTLKRTLRTSVSPSVN